MGTASGKAIWSCGSYWVYGDTEDSEADKCLGYLFHRSRAVCPIFENFGKKDSLKKYYNITCATDDDEQLITQATNTATMTTTKITTTTTIMDTQTTVATGNCCTYFSLSGYIVVDGNWIKYNGECSVERKTSTNHYAYSCKETNVPRTRSDAVF